MVESSFMNCAVVGSNLVAFEFTCGPAWSKEFLDIQANFECRFTLKLIRDMIIIYNLKS